jgi:hypothetical protein
VIDQRLFVERMHAIDEGAVPFSVRLEIVAERPVDEDVDDIRKADVNKEIEALEQPRHDVLRPHSFKAFTGAIPVFV